MNNAAFPQYWQSRLATSSFRDNVNSLYLTSIDTILDTNISQYIATIKSFLQNRQQQLNLKENSIETGSEALNLVGIALVHSLWPIGRQTLIDANPSLAQMLNSDTHAKWHDVFAQGLSLEKDDVAALIDHPAIREVLATVIKDAILAFNKKLNPLFGAVSLFGMEKQLGNQLKEFINPFMDNALIMVRDFIADPENQKLFADFAAQAFDTIAQEHVATHIKNFPEPSAHKLQQAISATIADATLHQQLISLGLKFLEYGEETLANTTLRQLTEQHNGLKLAIQPIDDNQWALIVPYLASTPLSQFMAAEFEAMQSNLS